MELLGAMLVVMAAGEVSLQVAPGVPCASHERMTERLRAAGLTVVAAPSRRLAVTASEVEGWLQVRGRRSGTDFERAIPLTGSGCDAVERALVVLIASWSRQLPVVTPPLVMAKQLTPVSALDSPAPVVAGKPTPAGTAAKPAVESHAAPPADAAGPAVAAQSFVAMASSELPSRESESATARSPRLVPELTQAEAPSSEHPFVLDLGLLGGGAAGPTSDVVTSGQFLVALGVKRIAAVADVGLQTTRVGVVSLARVQVSSQWASLAGRLRFAPAERIELEGSLGVRGWRFEAVSNAPAASTVVFGIGGVATLAALGAGAADRHRSARRRIS